MKDTNVPVERKCEYCGCPESTAVNAGVKCNMTPGKPLHSFQEKSVPVESTCGCKESSCKDDCSRNHTHKTFSCNECSVPVEKWEKEFDEKFGDNLSLDGPFDKSYAKLVLAPALKLFISQAIQAAVEEERTSHRVRVGMLRQWLNEDRITDTSKMVTNEDIEYWLSIINKHQ